jgi:3',5'-cyclic-AMP phosphodiesterase
MTVIAHVSDTHLDGGPARSGRLASVMAYLNNLAMPLAAVVITGDIADHGLPEEYQQVRELLALSPHPVLCCPGNHDDRSAFRAVLLGEDGGGPDPGGPVNQARAVGDVLIALCDSTIPGRDDGLLADDTLAWLDGVLTAHPGRPAIVCCHHPPVPLHSPDADELRQFGEQRLSRLLAGHPQVAAILCGHAHTPAAAAFAGRPLRVAPGVASTLVLPWEHGGILDEQAPPAVAFHILAGQQLTTHYRVVR